ncbi:hypothetical protein BUALT_Bualt03G0220000 [Buddleja alternifolia]|uniref:RNase H type-1 domain-containing protein n=1 Tax=Buddleja alternifolia TaxID=168488 RepID=A0AAV6XXZ4_9LAMI|nr:hypothetical protein BUALT_Bualt03G0220000 [Buddleja alternifolia]
MDSADGNDDQGEFRWIRTVFDNPKATGASCISRDSNGQYVAWRQQRFNFGSIPEVAEALAALEAIQMARRRGWRKIQLEGDCLGLISKLREKSRDFSYLYRSATVEFDGGDILPPQVLFAVLVDYH